MTRTLAATLIALLAVGAVACVAQGPNTDDARVMQFVYTVWPQRGQYFHRMGLQNRFAVDPAGVDISAAPGSDRQNLLQAIERIRPDLQYDNNRALTMDWWGKPEISPTPLEWIEEQKRLGATVHEMMRDAGAGKLFTYVSAFRIFGNYDEREGFWAFYDNWEDYAPLHFGPKPPEDPWDWISLIDGERRQWRVNPDDYYGYRRYNACVENPHWRAYMEAVCRNIAEDGIDGVFVDNTMHRCECRYCQRAFEEHLRAEYTPEQLEEFFGTRDVRALRINSRDSIPLQIETQRVWQRSLAGLLAHLKRGGEAAVRVDDFMVITNGTAYGLSPGYCSSITEWADAGMTAGFNEVSGEQMGCPRHEIAEGLCTNELQDQITHYASIAGLGRSGVRAAPQQDRYYLRARPETFTLAMFEALAFGGIFCDTGNLIGEYEIYPNTEALRGRLYDFYHARHDLYTDMTSAAEIGLMLALVDESLAENWDYEIEAQAVRDLLLDQHVPFDLLPEGALTPENLRRYSLIIVPGVSCIGDEQTAALREYAQAGGRVLATGSAGTRHICGAPRPQSCLAAFAQHAPWLWREGLHPEIPFRHAAGWYRGMALRGHNPLARLHGLAGREDFVGQIGALIDRNPAAVSSESDAPGVRVTVTRPRDEADRRIIAHLVNYDLWWDADLALDPGSMDMPDSARVESKSLTLVVRTPPGSVVDGVRVHAPDSGVAEPRFEQLADGVAVQVPDLAIYAAVEVSLDDGAPAGRTVAEVLGPVAPRAAPPAFVRREENGRPIPEPLLRSPEGGVISPWMALDQVLLVPRRAGERLEGVIEVSDRWGWGAKVWVYAPDCGTVYMAGLGPGESESFGIECEQEGLYVICGDAGLANWRVSVEYAALILPTSADRPMQTCGMPAPMRFVVPQGVERFTITTRAADPEMRIETGPLDAGTTLAAPLEAREQTHEIVVPDGGDGRLWTVLVSRGDRELHRTMPLHFSEEIPGALACAP